MKHILSNKHIFVVGAAGLLGSALVKAVLSHGGNVIAADIDIEKIKAALRKVNVDIFQSSLSLIPVDITNENSIEHVFGQFERIDGAVNCTYPRNKHYGAHFFDVTFDSFNDNVSLHLGSAFLFTQKCALYFKKTKRPFSLVNISSVYGVVAPDFSVYQKTSMTMPVEYSAIKAAILHLNKYVSSYVNDSNFRVNSVSPGGIFDHQPESFLRAYKSKTNGAGMLDVTSVLGSIVFLLSDLSQYVVAQNIIVDDGFST